MYTLKERWELIYRHSRSVLAAGTHVYTPSALVRQLVQPAPTDVTSTWCDPCCGRGTFLIEAFVVLMEALKHSVPDEKIRAKGIVSRLYGCDIDPIQIDIAHRTLGDLISPYGLTEDDLHLFCADGLIYDWGMQFDVSIGNPPFQPDVNKGEGRGNGSGNKIWQKFIERAFELTKDNGHLLFVTPHNWRTGNFKPRAQHRRAQQLIFDNDVQWWIDARNDNGVDHFPTIGNSNSVDAWHVVKGQKGELPEVLQRLCLLPKSSDPETLAKVARFFQVCEREEALEWHGCDSTGRGKDLEKCSHGDATHRFRVAGTSAQVRDGVFHWSSEKRATFDLKKVMVCDSGQPVIGYDDGTMANGRHTGCYIVGSKEEGDKLVNFLRSPLVKFVSGQFMREGALGFPMELFERIPKRVLSESWEEVFK